MAICNGNLSFTEYNSLFSVYNATQGDQWRWPQNSTYSSHWNFPSLLSAPCVDQWQGLTCTGISPGKCTITEIHMPFYHLDGTLPSELGNFHILGALVLPLNHLYGTLPTELGQLQHLEVLSLGENLLTGTISSQLFSDLKSLKVVSLDANFFTGTLPTVLAQLSALNVLSAGVNHLSGPVFSAPSSSLSHLYLEKNLLTGVFPTDMAAHLPALTHLWLNQNNLTGTVPDTVGDFKAIFQLYMNNNSFIGPVPSALGLLTTLTEFTLMFNYLTGTVPTQLGNLSAIQSLALFGNLLTGTLPSELGKLSTVQFLALFSNSLTGTVPEAYWNLTSIQGFALNSNMLTGSMLIPMSSSLDFIYMYDNYFTGNIPQYLFTLTTLTQMLLQDNYLCCRLSPAVSAFKNLTDFSIGLNYFSGLLEPSFSDMARLSLFDVSSNMLHAPVDSLFPSERNTGALQLIDLSQNAFSGTLPSYLFRSKVLQTITMFSNCIHGSIPTTICTSPVLTSIVMDGISSAPSCEVKLPPGLKDVIAVNFPSHLVQGSIPSCLWASETIRVLHLAGNGLTGTMGELSSKSQFTDINLAFNALEGSIPLSLQESDTLTQIGLASNRLSGTLSSQFKASASSVIDLTVNRLSGDIPPGLYNVVQLNILDGNLFQCQQLHMPEHDPSRKSYSCGSTNFNASLVVWGVTAVVVVLISFVLSKMWTAPKKVSCSPLSESIAMAHTLAASSSTDLPGAKSLPTNGSGTGDDEGSSSFRVSFLAQSLSLSIYNIQSELQLSVRSATLSTNCSQFLTFLSEASVTSIALTTMYVACCMTTYVALKLLPNSSSNLFSTHQLQYGWISTAAFLHGGLPAAILSCFLISSLVIVRVLFLSIGLSHQKSSATSATTAAASETNVGALPILRTVIPIGIQIINAAVTLVINYLYVFGILNGVSRNGLLGIQLAFSMFKLTWMRVIIPSLINRMSFLSIQSRRYHTLIMNLMLYLAGPIIATYIGDSTCLYYALSGQGNVVSSYAYTLPERPICFNPDSNTECFLLPELVSANTNYAPPWLYSYQCSSTLLQSYVPVFMYSYIMSGVLLPLAMYTFVSHYEAITRLIPADQTFGLLVRNTIFEPIRLTSSSEPASESNLNRFSLFRGAVIENRTMLDFTILLTFGLAAPVLAIAITVQIVVVGFLWRFLIDSYLQRSLELSQAAGRLQLVGDCESPRAPSSLTTSAMHCPHSSLTLPRPISSPAAASSITASESRVGGSKDVSAEELHRFQDSVDSVASSIAGQQDQILRHLEQATDGSTAGLSICMRVIAFAVGVFWGLLLLDIVADVYGSLAGGISFLFVAFFTPGVYMLIEWIQLRHSGLPLVGSGAGGVHGDAEADAEQPDYLWGAPMRSEPAGLTTYATDATNERMDLSHLSDGHARTISVIEMRSNSRTHEIDP